MLLPCNIARILPYKVANFRSTFPFCCGVPGAVSSKLTPKPSFSHARCRARFSPALSQRTIFTTISYLDFRSLIREMILSEVLLFFLRKKLHVISVQSSTTRSQWCFPPMLAVLGELMSMKILSPGIFDLLLPLCSFLLAWHSLLHNLHKG